MQAVGSVMTNIYSEGYPGARYYGGNEYADGYPLFHALRFYVLSFIFHCVRIFAVLNSTLHSDFVTLRLLYLKICWLDTDNRETQWLQFGKGSILVTLTTGSHE